MRRNQGWFLDDVSEVHRRAREHLSAGTVTTRVTSSARSRCSMIRYFSDEDPATRVTLEKLLHKSQSMQTTCMTFWVSAKVVRCSPNRASGLK